jgi:hypothetical protein
MEVDQEWSIPAIADHPNSGESMGESRVYMKLRNGRAEIESEQIALSISDIMKGSTMLIHPENQKRAAGINVLARFLNRPDEFE